MVKTLKRTIRRLWNIVSFAVRQQVSITTARAIRCDRSSRVVVGRNVKIFNSKIVVSDHSNVVIEDGVSIQGYNIEVSYGNLKIGTCSLLKQEGYYAPSINIQNGRANLDHHCTCRASIDVRFGGTLKIGCFTCVNEGTQIRCDESVEIGDFVMVSYDCLIFDTNTHQVLPAQVRRERTMADYPYIGRELDKPVTKPVYIADDAWIGQRSAILKGVRVGKKSIIGMLAVVVQDVPDGCLAVGNPATIKAVST